MRFVVIAMVAGLSALAAAPPPPKEIKSPASPKGSDVFRSHCASCHGADGKGAGPVAESLRMRPSDLTTMKRRNAGEFPTFRLQKMLDGSEPLPVHGSKRMPVWGPGLGAEAARALIQHMESIQK